MSMPADVLFRTYVTSDAVLMVSIEDTLTWLRAVEVAWEGKRAENVAQAVAVLADDLRDSWLDATRQGDRA